MRVIYKFIYLGIIVCLSSCSMMDAEQVPVPVPQPVASAVVVSPAPAASTPNSHNARAAYVAEGNGRLYLCSIANDNKLVNCAITGMTTKNTAPAWLPDSVALHTINGSKYAYIASNSSVFICSIAADNELTNCHTTGSDGNRRDMEWLPTDLKINSKGSVPYAYITGVKGVYQCAIASDGSLNKCVSTGFSVLHKPMIWVTNAINFNQLNGHTYAYIAGSKRLYQCDLAPDGSLINCHPTGTDAKSTKIRWHPGDISFSKESGGFYAYIADPSRMYQCNVDAKGGIINCTAGGLDINNLHWLPNNIVFNIAGIKKYAYVIGVYNIFVCNVGTYGALTGCVMTGTTPAGATIQWNPNNITLTGE